MHSHCIATSWAKEELDGDINTLLFRVNRVTIDRIAQHVVNRIDALDHTRTVLDLAQGSIISWIGRRKRDVLADASNPPPPMDQGQLVQEIANSITAVRPPPAQSGGASGSRL